MATTTASPLLDKKNIVSVEDCLRALELQKTSNHDPIVFVDGSWYHKGDRNGRQEFEQGPRIASARYVDMQDIATTKELYPELNPKGLKAMLPTKELFAATMDAFGIQNDNHIVIYGKQGTIFLPRTWFLFRSMGHDIDKVHLMEGSLEEWRDAGGPMEDGPTMVPKARDILAQSTTNPLYVARDPPPTVVSMEQLQKVVGERNHDDDDNNNNKNVLLLDTRGNQSFAAGHVPGSINLPYSDLVQKDHPHKLKSRKELKELFHRLGIDVLTDKKVYFTCGSGVSVCNGALAFEECGRHRNQPTYIYDGSWQEWGKDPNTPKEESVEEKE